MCTSPRRPSVPAASGQAIVEEARRRGVEAIVLGAEEPSRIRGGARFGGRRGLESYVGDVVRYVVARASCRVIVTASPVRSDVMGRVPTSIAWGPQACRRAGIV